ncbi:protein kinase C delta type-like [Xenopus laevis]|uniref:Protein kinase C delta type-like n=1 Tax=Xenopus laevis TaxID=8355 RepID=A0A8J1KQU7_XENLA|nr:protein kinase C delta type-like [Xenopus laevis]
MDSTINMIKQIRSQLEEDSRMETHERVKRKREQSPETNNKRPHQKTERARERRRRKRERRRQRLLYEKKEEQRWKRPRSSDRDEAEEGESAWKRPHMDEERCDPLDISSYNFHQELGNGSFGNVMLASLPDRKNPVAIKILKKENIALKDRYETEVKVMKLAWKCPFLCNIHAAFQTQVQLSVILQ